MAIENVSKILLLDLMDSSSEEESNAEWDEVVAVIGNHQKEEKRYWLADHIRFRKERGEFRLFYDLDDEKFTNYFRMSRNQFYELHDLIKSDVKKQNTKMRESISTLERLAVTLRFIASGDTFRSMAYSYRMGERTISEIVEEVCHALWKHLQPLVLAEPTTADWKKTANDFTANCQFDHCVGAIDGKHIIIKAPPNSGSDFFNYKKTFSTVLLAVADSNKKFLYIDVGSMGRFSDSGILSDSVFGQKLKDGELMLPQEEPLYPGGVPMPYVFVGDAAFPLLVNLMRPYPETSSTTVLKRVFNYRLCRARRVVENAFGILASRFRVFRRPFECRVDLVDKVVKAACVLHNYLIKFNFYDIKDDEIEPLNASQLTPLVQSGFRYGNDSFFVREEMCTYYNFHAALPWQRTRVQDQLRTA